LVAIGRDWSREIWRRAGLFVLSVTPRIAALGYYLIHRPKADSEPGIAAFKTWICTQLDVTNDR
jgi:hypothetical protein